MRKDVVAAVFLGFLCLCVMALSLHVRPRIIMQGAAVRIKVTREPKPQHRTLTIAVVDEIGPLRLSEIDLSETDRKTWDVLWDGIPAGNYEVIARIWPTNERTSLTLEVVGGMQE